MHNNSEKNSLPSLVKLWLNNKLRDREFSNLVSSLMHFFKIWPENIACKSDLAEERRQLVSEFLCEYRSKRGAFILFGEFTDAQIQADIISKLKNFSYTFQSDFRKRLNGRINSVLKPENGFKRLQGKIVGRIKDIEMNTPSVFSEQQILYRWLEIEAPNLNSQTGLPAIKDLLPVIEKMFDLAQGWVFKQFFYQGIESLLGVVEPKTFSYQNSTDFDQGIIGLEDLAPQPDFAQDSFFTALKIRESCPKIEKSVKSFIANISKKWQLILFLMLIERYKASKASKYAEITQQACGKAYRKMVEELRIILSQFNDIEQQTFLHLLRKLLTTNLPSEKRARND